MAEPTKSELKERLYKAERDVKAAVEIISALEAKVKTAEQTIEMLEGVNKEFRWELHNLRAYSRGIQDAIRILGTQEGRR